MPLPHPTSSLKHNAKKILTAAPLLILLILAALIFLLPVQPARAAGADALTPVRAGYFYNGDFMHKDTDGNYTGYDIEYYYTLAGYAGWNIQFVEYDSLNSAMAALENGDIDIMSGLSKTTDRESKFLISSQKMSTAHIAVQTRSDDDRFAAGDISTMTQMTCGILKGSNVVTLYANWCAENGLTPHIVEYDSLQQRNAALAAGEVDAIAGGSTIDGAQKIAEFPSLDLFFMLNKNQAGLKSQLDRAMGILALENPTFAISLFATYFPTTRNTAPSFSAGEKAYIASHPVIQVAVLEDDAPFSKGTTTGVVEGILPDYFDHLSTVTGITFQCVPYATKERALQALDQGRVDMVGKFEDDAYQAEASQVILTVPYLKNNMVQITRAGTETVSVTAVPQCNTQAVAERLKAENSGVTLATYACSKECFDALKSGEVDSVICTESAATWLLNRNRASDYVVSAFGNETWDVACALNYGADGNTLRSILSKSITTDNGYINQLITSDTLADSASLATLFDRLPVSAFASVLVASVVLLGLVTAALIIILRRRNTEHALAAQQAELAAAEETNKARQAFSGTVSHDMRTPLNGIMGMTNLAMESTDPDQIRDYLTKIRSSGTILSNLVNDMLITSRIENGKYVLEPTACDLCALFAAVMEPIDALAKAKQVTLEKECMVSGGPVMADRLSLQKIALNLLTNALKFTPAGGTVTFSCKTAPAEGGQVTLTMVVSDTGVGIAPEFLPHVFEPFAQEIMTGADSAGSGMGLSIVKSIVDAMKGTIDIASVKNQGTTFTIRLDLPQADAVADSEPPAPRDTERLKGKRALICEDNAINLNIIMTLLGRMGLETEGAQNGQEGLDLFTRSDAGYYDVILLDLRMPVMDGLTTARAIRGLDRSDAAAVPIIAVSADAYPENIQECLDAKMNAHIAKPIDPDVLADTLMRCFDQ